MNIDIEEIVKDEYEIIGKDGFVYGCYGSIDDAVKFLKNFSRNFSPKDVRYNGMRIRHKLTAYIDHSVDCAELVEKKTKKQKKSH